MANNKFHNYTPLIIAVSVVAGILMQELLPSEPRTAYIALTMGAAMMFIHYTEFSFQPTVEKRSRYTSTARAASSGGMPAISANDSYSGGPMKRRSVA